MEKTKTKKTKTTKTIARRQEWRCPPLRPRRVHKRVKKRAAGIAAAHKRIRSRQITYPAPYAQSWNVDTAPVLKKGHFGKGPKMFLFKNPKKRTDSQKTWSKSYSAVRGPDPTAPHLKYGVFPNRRASSSRNLPKSPLKPIHNPHCQRVQEVRSLSNRTFPVPARKKPVKKGQSSDSPMLVIRALDKAFTKQLSLSEIMHVDIKPRKLITGPSFCPPNYKGLTKLTAPG